MLKRIVIITLFLLSLASAPIYAQNPTVSRPAMENALVNDAGFIARLDGFLTKSATVVLVESGGTSNHAARLAFAKKVLQGSRSYAIRAAGYIIHTDNFEGQTIQISPFGSGFAVTIATVDADAAGQIFAVWDTLADLFGGA